MQERFKSDMEFRNQIIVSAIKFRKMICELYDVDSLVKKSFWIKSLLQVLKSATGLDAQANWMS